MANKTVELVNLWADYEAKHPAEDIAEFCRDFLLKQEQKKRKIKFARSAVPPHATGVLAKMLGRVARLLNNYAEIALRQCGLSGFEDFFYLNDIKENGLPKKTDIIYANFNELSSGLLILGRLKKAGLITEKDDVEDKRSKQLQITDKGNKLLQACYTKLDRINDIFFEEMPQEDRLLCIQLLSPTETKFSTKWIEDRRKSFTELIDGN
jgi:predicted transcriptional regulator